MRDWASTAALAGPRPEIALAHLQYVECFEFCCLSSNGNLYEVLVSLIAVSALRRFGFHKGVYLQTDGLQLSNLAPEFRSIHCGGVGITHRIGPLGRDQNSHPKSELR